MMRLRAAVWFSAATWRLPMTASNRFWIAPKLARSALMVVSAASICVMTVWDDACVRMLTGPGMAGGVVKSRMAVIEGAVDILTDAIVIRSLASLPAPIWKVWGVTEASTEKPLKRV